VLDLVQPVGGARRGFGWGRQARFDSAAAHGALFQSLGWRGKRSERGELGPSHSLGRNSAPGGRADQRFSR
jgi:hypothetical protein